MFVFLFIYLFASLFTYLIIYLFIGQIYSMNLGNMFFPIFYALGAHTWTECFTFQVALVILLLLLHILNSIKQLFGECSSVLGEMFFTLCVKPTQTECKYVTYWGGWICSHTHTYMHICINLIHVYNIRFYSAVGSYLFSLQYNENLVPNLQTWNMLMSLYVFHLLLE